MFGRVIVPPVSPLRPRARSLSDKEVKSQQDLQHSERRQWNAIVRSEYCKSRRRALVRVSKDSDFVQRRLAGMFLAQKKSWRPIASCESCEFV